PLICSWLVFSVQATVVEQHVVVPILYTLICSILHTFHATGISRWTSNILRYGPCLLSLIIALLITI
ncbi:hypothetical protein C8J57DRAFT_1411711, partial [Mycena rebaudengoi]